MWRAIFDAMTHPVAQILGLAAFDPEAAYQKFKTHYAGRLVYTPAVKSTLGIRRHEQWVVDGKLMRANGADGFWHLEGSVFTFALECAGDVDAKRLSKAWSAAWDILDRARKDKTFRAPKEAFVYPGDFPELEEPR